MADEFHHVRELGVGLNIKVFLTKLINTSWR